MQTTENHAACIQRFSSVHSQTLLNFLLVGAQVKVIIICHVTFIRHLVVGPVLWSATATFIFSAYKN